MLDIRQDVFEIVTPAGETLHCVYNSAGQGRPLAVVPPLLAGTVRLNLLPMLYLVNNGFDVLRFDFSNHPGNSSGRHDAFTMSRALADIDAVMAHVGEW